MAKEFKESQEPNNLLIEELEDQKAAEKEYNEIKLSFTDGKDIVELPAGTVLLSRITGKFVRVKENIIVRIEERDSTNYDNQRVASYGGQEFWAKGKFGLPRKHSGLSEEALAVEELGLDLELEKMASEEQKNRIKKQKNKK